MDFDRLIDTARLLKLTRQTGRAFHVAFVLRQRKVVAVGFNHFHKSNAICIRYKPTRFHESTSYRGTLHAEIDCMGKIKFQDSRKLTMVSIRIDNHNRPAFAQPCPNCAYHLGRWGLNKIFYTGRNGEICQLR